MRYFLFRIEWVNDSAQGFGFLLVKNETFPSMTELKSEFSSKSGDPSITDDCVVVMGWNEFNSEDDYNSFKGDGK